MHYRGTQQAQPARRSSDDAHALTDCRTSNFVHIPSTLMAGIATDDTDTSAGMEDSLLENFTSTLQTYHPLTWEQGNIGRYD